MDCFTARRATATATSGRAAARGGAHLLIAKRARTASVHAGAFVPRQSGECSLDGETPGHAAAGKQRLAHHGPQPRVTPPGNPLPRLEHDAASRQGERMLRKSMINVAASRRKLSLL